MKAKLMILGIVLSASLFSGCRKDFADINVDPTVVTKGNVISLYTKGMQEFEPSGYLFWFYNARYTQQWCQAFTPTGGFTDNFNKQGDVGDQGTQTIKVLKYYREVSYILSNMNATEAQRYESIKGILNALVVYLGMFDTDMYGDMPYVDAVKARFSNPVILAPKYDKLEDLYSLWLTELNTALVSLNVSNQVSLGNQDFVYGGDLAKWRKFVNSLKLKLAVRYLSVNKQKSLQIAEEVVANVAGVMNSLDDDFIYNRATGLVGDDNGDNAYHFGNSVSTGAGAKPVVDLLIKNLDPRVRFFYNKNDFNSRVVQGFFDARKDLPAYIESNVNYTTDGSGKKTFVSWKAPGEPWIRYYGLPTDYNAANNPAYFDYFDFTRWKITLNGQTRTYYPYASFQEELVRGRVDYTYPDVPGSSIVQDKEDVPWYGMFLSTAEVNLYLAELKLYGANLPQSAETYYNKGVEMSVRAYDKLARLNRIPYYTVKYDPKEEFIGLKSGEVEALLATDDYKFTGTTADMLEKVYIQEYLHFMYQPDDQFAAVKRSGVPKKGSTILPWVDIAPQGNTYIPRRFDIASPSPTDLMYNNIIEAASRQGFSFSIFESPNKLNSERVWNDKGAPNFGEGPTL